MRTGTERELHGGPALEESELIERAKRGDVSAYEALVRAHQELAVRTAYVVAGADDAHDAVQEAFVKAYRALPRFRDGSPFRPWLLRIVANEAINRRRAGRRDVLLSLRLAERAAPERAEGRPAGDAAPSPERTALEHERRRELLAAVSSLAPPDRLVIAYRYWFDLSESEMAAALGVARGTVKSRLARALARLRARLEDAGGPGASRAWLESVDG